MDVPIAISTASFIFISSGSLMTVNDDPVRMRMIIAAIKITS